jgi:hypothetical protein
MKKVDWKCDVCGNPTDEQSIHQATLAIGRARSTSQYTHYFDVCSTCYTETPKGVFQKAFNALLRSVGRK